jgi:thiamine biosynthesis lipoprotein
LSTGAFDPTVGPLVDLWGFGPQGRQPHPAADAIRATLATIGYTRLAVREQPAALRKSRADVRLDLSAIGNGLGVDRVADHLERIGIDSYLIELGGELRGRGRNARGKPWAVAVEQPGGGATTALAVVRLDDAAISTSGAYRNYFDEGGRRYNHIIDPRTGVPIGHDLILVSVIDDSAMRADALATALLVLGPDSGVRLARHEGIPALFVLRDDDGLQQLRTPEFAQRLVH